MKKKTKNLITTILLIMALLQGPYFYYFCQGFQIIVQPIFCFVALFLTIYLLIKLIKYRSTNSLYHIIGLIAAFIIGLSTFRQGIIEYLDFKFRKGERMAVIKQVNEGKLTPDTTNGRHTWTLPNGPFFCISKRNQVDIDENKNGIVIVKFYTDLGFLDDGSRAFVYTNDPVKIQVLDKRILSGEDENLIKKLDNNWYRIEE